MTVSNKKNQEFRVKKSNIIPLKRVFTEGGKHPFDGVIWVKLDAVVGNGDKKFFEQQGVEFPDFWSQNAVNITAAKYFRGKLNTPEREWSVKQMIGRVTKTIRGWGEKFNYFKNVSQAQIFEDELMYLLLHQRGSFNSPVWFNVGVREKPQCSACFILSVKDDMVSILDWIKTEGMIFKSGSGSGVNLSVLRSKKEQLSGGGYASGPVSFMRGADSVAGMIKSGGTTRRAAKMVVLNINHPDVLDFIRSKAEEEKKVRALAAAGYDMADLNNEAWTSIQFQNANNSVRIVDEFMKAVEEDAEWETKYRLSGEVADRYRARDLLLEIAEAAWACGDPGVQFDTVINDWHTCPNSGRINASNPCAEYMHLDDSACNLVSINLLRFLREDGTIAVDELKQTVQIFILAQEIIIDGSGYPTPKIAENAHDFRELGLGFANLGALLMMKGLPYDSENGAALASAITSFICGEAYRFSAVIARKMGPFEGYALNREPMLRVIKKHQVASYAIPLRFVDDEELAHESQKVWDEALALGEQHGFRNSQTTLIAPTGTISFMMDCDTTGIEPDFSLVKMKQLVGGGWMKMVNNAVPKALFRLDYSDGEVEEILNWILSHGTVEGAPHFREEHLAIFDCAVKPAGGVRSISWQGHVRMVAAVQPFVSGAISKTFNMPYETTKEEISDAYVMAWKLGIKAFAVYRDGSKASQPLQTERSQAKKQGEGTPAAVSRRRLPATRNSETHKFVIGDHEGYLTYSIFNDGSLAEIFIRMAKQGSTLSGLLDAFAISVSMALQYGVPLKELVKKFIYTRFEPAGFTENENVRVATSIVDYIFRFLAFRFLDTEDLADFGMIPLLEDKSVVEQEIKSSEVKVAAAVQQEELKKKINGKTYVPGETVCRKCGGIMVRSGSCLTCTQCGDTSGGCS